MRCIGERLPDPAPGVYAVEKHLNRYSFIKKSRVGIKSMIKVGENNMGKSQLQFGLEQYDRETLLKLMKAYSRLYISVDGFWYLAVKNDAGDGKALDYDIWVWEKMYKREIDRITAALGIKERDVLSYLKIFTMTPWFHSIEYEVKIEDNNRGILTINHCPTLLTLEKEGEGREKNICNVVDIDYFKKACKYFNPDMECKPILIPPRNKKEGICCQWEFTILST
jgi:hypothetical protein